MAETDHTLRHSMNRYLSEGKVSCNKEVSKVISQGKVKCALNVDLMLGIVI